MPVPCSKSGLRSTRWPPACSTWLRVDPCLTGHPADGKCRVWEMHHIMERDRAKLRCDLRRTVRTMHGMASTELHMRGNLTVEYSNLLSGKAALPRSIEDLRSG